MSNEGTETPLAPASAGDGIDGMDAQDGRTAAPEAQVVPGPEELTALRARAAEADILRDRALRAVADLENFRKRAARERQEAVQFANQSLLEKLIPALDNLDMALLAVTSGKGATIEAMRTGVEMVLAQLRSTLRDAGLEEIDAAGQAFDPAWHEAVSEQETADVPDGHVVQQLRKGYKLRQRLLRPANVVVARPPQA